MKKIISLFLSLTLVFCFAGCKEKKTEFKNTVDTEYYAKKGQMPESEFKIGDGIEDVKAQLEKDYNPEESDDETGEPYVFTEGNETAVIDTGNFNYYYKKESANKGISYIVSFDKAFGFDLGTLNVDVISALQDFEYKAEELNEDNGFFILGEATGKVLNFSFGNYTAAFVFVDNALYATALYLTAEWK